MNRYLFTSCLMIDVFLIFFAHHTCCSYLFVRFYVALTNRTKSRILLAEGVMMFIPYMTQSYMGSVGDQVFLCYMVEARLLHKRQPYLLSGKGSATKKIS